MSTYSAWIRTRVVTETTFKKEYESDLDEEDLKRLIEEQTDPKRFLKSVPKEDIYTRTEIKSIKVEALFPKV